MSSFLRMERGLVMSLLEKIVVVMIGFHLISNCVNSELTKFRNSGCSPLNLITLLFNLFNNDRINDDTDFTSVMCVPWKPSQNVISGSIFAFD